MAAARSAMRSTRAPSRPNSQNSVARGDQDVLLGQRRVALPLRRLRRRARAAPWPRFADAQPTIGHARSAPRAHAARSVPAALPPARLTSNHPVTYWKQARSRSRAGGIDMATRRLGIIMHGVTGRMGTNQHLVRSILAIRADGGVTLAERRHASCPTRSSSAGTPTSSRRWRSGTASSAGRPISPPRSPIRRTRSSSTPARRRCARRSIRQAIEAGKHVYCEKPTRRRTSPTRSRSRGSPRSAASRTASCRTSSSCPGC